MANVALPVGSANKHDKDSNQQAPGHMTHPALPHGTPFTAGVTGEPYTFLIANTIPVKIQQFQLSDQLKLAYQLVRF